MSFNPLPETLATCQLCPRLVAHRQAVAQKRSMPRREYANEIYWGKPVPGFGDPKARILLLGLAPGAHGSNRTGRMFTGDASGAFLFPALYRAGLASQADSSQPKGRLNLSNLWITAVCRCVPPGNKPLRSELTNCRTWLHYDLGNLPHLRVILALGKIAHDAYLDILIAQGLKLRKADYSFSHGSLHKLPKALPLLSSYHVSYQNTNTGRLTAAMFDDILLKAKHLASAA